MSVIWTFLRDEDGPTAVEYAVMLLILLAAFVGLTALSNEHLATWQNNANEIGVAIGGP